MGREGRRRGWVQVQVWALAAAEAAGCGRRRTDGVVVVVVVVCAGELRRSVPSLAPFAQVLLIAGLESGLLAAQGGQSSNTGFCSA